MNLFDILGPVMVGPSSSHTAGAVRIGRVARLILGSRPVEARFMLHGSFAMTGEGHGTKQALVAGLLGMRLDDEQILVKAADDAVLFSGDHSLSFLFSTYIRICSAKRFQTVAFKPHKPSCRTAEGPDLRTPPRRRTSGASLSSGSTSSLPRRSSERTGTSVHPSPASRARSPGRP